jgi:putative transposase
MKPQLAHERVLDALVMAVWHRRPKNRVMVHSNQGSQYGSDDWRRFLKANNRELSMIRSGNCCDNAVAESFFSSFRKERIKKRVYKTRDLARAAVFDYIEASYNPTRRHSHLGGSVPKRSNMSQNAPLGWLRCRAKCSPGVVLFAQDLGFKEGATVRG